MRAKAKARTKTKAGARAIRRGEVSGRWQRRRRGGVFPAAPQCSGSDPANDQFRRDLMLSAKCVGNGSVRRSFANQLVLPGPILLSGASCRLRRHHPSELSRVTPEPPQCSHPETPLPTCLERVREEKKGQLSPLGSGLSGGHTLPMKLPPGYPSQQPNGLRPASDDKCFQTRSCRARSIHP